MAPAVRRWSAADRHKSYSRQALYSSNSIPAAIYIVFLVFYILTLVMPGETISSLRSVDSWRVEPNASHSISSLTSAVHVETNHKESGSISEEPSVGLQHEGANADGRTSGEDSGRQPSVVQASGTAYQRMEEGTKPGHPQKTEPRLPASKYTGSEKSPEHLGTKELLELPYEEGVYAIWAQSHAMANTLKEGLVESQALKEAANISVKLRGEIVKDVDALSRTLEQEHANLAVVRQYEREQDALLKAQLGYLTPIISSQRREALTNAASDATCIATPLIAVACSAFLFFGI